MSIPMFFKGYEKRVRGPCATAALARNPKPPKAGQDECEVCGQGIERPASKVAVDMGNAYFLTPAEAAKARGAGVEVSEFSIGPECAKDRRLKGYVVAPEAVR